MSASVPTYPPIAKQRHLRVVEQPELELEWQMPSGVDAEPHIPPILQLIDGGDKAPELPDAAVWTSRLTSALVEVLAGERPASQLSRWLARDVFTEVSRHAQTVKPRRTAARRKIGTVRVCRVAPGIVETSAVVIGTKRARAVALRLEVVRGRWLATSLSLI